MIADKFLQVFQSKYFAVPILIVSIAVLIVVFYFSSIKEEIILPASGQYVINGYTDAVNGGNTQITEESVSDSVFTFRFQLKEGFYSPYAGFSVAPSVKTYMDASQYNQISICVSSVNIERLGVALYTPMPDEYNITNDDEELHHAYLNISEEKTTYHIPFNQMKHPEWWDDLHQISEGEKMKPDYSQIIHINVGSAYSPDITQEKILKVYSIAFRRNNQRLYATLAILYLSVFTLWLLMVYQRLFRKSRKKEVIITYKPIEVEGTNQHNDELCIDYINQSFNNNDLSLDLVTNETGISQRKIAQVINERYACNFKSYVNRLRISEAQRLLSETDLNIGEIAYKVGFNNQSHFNRVFKTELQMSPTECRDNQR